MARSDKTVRALAELTRLIAVAMDLAQIGDDEALRRQMVLIRDKLDQLYKIAATG